MFPAVEAGNHGFGCLVLGRQHVRALNDLTGCGHGWQDVLAHRTLQDGLEKLLIMVDLHHVRITLILCWTFEARDAYRPGTVVLFKAV